MIGLLAAGMRGMPSVVLPGPRTFLRPPRPGDWRGWANVRQDSKSFLTPWEPTWPQDALSRGAFLRRVRRQALEWREDEAYSFLVFRASDEVVMGGIGLSNIRRGVAQTGSLGYWIGEPFARHGFMTEAVAAIMDFAFVDLRLHRVEAACLPNNEPSRLLLLRSGFEQEGYARAYLKINGAWRDHLLFGITREDFQQRRAVERKVR
jgi:[ribosomal protein S5]-alanine N-acetyltransferase